METDSFFYLLLRKLPETQFAILHLPVAMAKDYRFDAVEVKKAYRLDGLFVPLRSGLPVYIVEAQMRASQKFYPNLFAKVFTYLEQHEPDQEWHAVAIFPDRASEPRPQPASEDLLTSRRISRIYLDEIDTQSDEVPGLKLLELLGRDEADVATIGMDLATQASHEPDCERTAVIVELVVEALMRRFPKLTRDEVRRMIKLYPIEQSVAYQEILQEGREKGREEGREEGLEKGVIKQKKEYISRLRKRGLKLKEIADLLGDPLAEVRRLARR